MVHPLTTSCNLSIMKSSYTKNQLDLLAQTMGEMATAQLQQQPNMSYADFSQLVYGEIRQQRKHLYKAQQLTTLKHAGECLNLLNQYDLPTELHKHLKNLRNLYVQDLSAIDSLTISASLGSPHILIIGAGLAGLLAAYVLTKQGAKVTVYEARSKEKAALRPQNISFKEAEASLRPILGESLYTEFFNRGGALDGNSGKLRLTTGTFQEVLSEALENTSATIHYDHPLTLDTLPDLQQVDAILIATGVHACERLGLDEHFNPHYFPDFSVTGQSFLYITPGTDAHGYHRQSRDGEHWRRDNISVFSQAAFKNDLLRVEKNILAKEPESLKAKRIKNLLNEKHIEYAFCFGNDTNKFFDDLPCTEQDIMMATHFGILPMITEKQISTYKNTPLIAIGDANGSPHPLAAIGTLKFTRNVPHLSRYLYSHCLFEKYKQQLPDMTVDNLNESIQAVFSAFTQENIEDVFLSNILCCLYSRKRTVY